MRPLILKCPSCNGDLSVSRIDCPSCNIHIEGEFSLPALLRLNRGQLDFVEVFVKNRGIIREVERELGVSYPTVRARLDEVIEAIGFNVSAGPFPTPDDRGDDSVIRNRRAILEELSSGKISPEDALTALGGSLKNSNSDSLKEKSSRGKPEEDASDG
jgi:hypothetical protein